MRAVRVHFHPFLVLASIWLMAVPAVAWEFSMEGNFVWEYYAYGQYGPLGFFGSYDTDNSDAAPLYGGSRGSAASMNGWLGNRIGQISSGSDMGQARLFMVVSPEVRLNPAIRIRGTYRIGSWANPTANTSEGALVRSEYIEGLAPGVQRSFSPGYWNNLWASAQTPWGIVVLGKRPGPFGIGLMFDAEDNADAAGVLLMASYGPLRIGFALVPYLFASPEYFALADKNSIRTWDTPFGMTYDSGPLSLGAGLRYFRFRAGPESQTFQGVEDPVAPTGRLGFIPTDTDVYFTVAYAKYNNGRFFFNGEMDWIHGITRRQRWLSTSPGVIEGNRSRFAPSFVEQTRFATELGLIWGPSKASILWAWIPGPDRRHGVRIDKQSDTRFVSAWSNVSLFKPYSLLIAYTYGGGNNSFAVDSANGYITDANVLAARVDYAVASNLNLFGSFLWADRISHGYGWGFIRPEYSIALARFTGSVQYDETDRFTDASPSIPDSNLGYEVGLGFAWKILEGYKIQSHFAFWQPGKWFNYACVDKSVENWKNPSPTNSFGSNPSRRIAAVFGLELWVSVDY